MTHEDFRDALSAALPDLPLYHMHAAPEEAGECLCWQELPDAVLYADNIPILREHCAQLDHFSVAEYSTRPTDIELALSAMGMTWTREPHVYDPDVQEWRSIWTVKWT